MEDKPLTKMVHPSHGLLVVAGMTIPLSRVAGFIKDD